MPSVPEMFQIRRCSITQAGHLQQAEALYRQILQVDPRHVEAIHLTGVIAIQVGKNDVAISYIQEALRLNPSFAAAHNNLGTALMALRKHTEALASFQQALRAAARLYRRSQQPRSGPGGCGETRRGRGQLPATPASKTG